MENHHDHLHNNPALIQSFNESQTRILSAQNSSEKADAVLVTVPVVIHVIHNGQAFGVDENIPTEQILSQLEVLNRDFRRLNPDTVDLPSEFSGLGGDAEIEFCLARFDPAGFPTTGINRMNMGQASWDRPDIESTLKPQTIWNRDKYLNIWIVRMGGDLAARNVQGYAQFPGMAANTDGLVIRFEAFGTTGNVSPQNNSGRTTVHEAGHWFGLFHIWGDDTDDPPQDRCDGSDQVMDTPNQEIEYYNCPTWPQSSCGSNDMYMNYMDYTDGDCQNIFTKGQVDRMRATLNTDRSGLFNAATACDYTFDAELVEFAFPVDQDTICASTFRPVIVVGNSAEEPITDFIAFATINGGAPVQTQVTGRISKGDTFEVQLNPMTVPDGGFALTVTLGSINGEANDQFPPNDFKTTNFTVTNGGYGAAMPFAEGFESGIPATWTIENPDNDRTWELANVGGFGQSSRSIRFDNFTSGPPSPNGRIDAVITEELDLSSGLWPQLDFSLAYARRDASSNDSLFVYASGNCGRDWTLVWRNGGNAMATNPDYGFPFTPAASNWSTNTADLNVVAGNSSVLVKFEHKSTGGNNVYVDDINIRKAVTSIEEPKPLDHISIYPNPASSIVKISGLEQDQEYNASLFDYLGQRVLQTSVYESIEIPTHLADGMYILRVENENASKAFILQILR